MSNIEKIKNNMRKKIVALHANEALFQITAKDHQTIKIFVPEYLSTKDKISDRYLKFLHQFMVNNYGFNFRSKLEFDVELFNTYQCLHLQTQICVESLILILNSKESKIPWQ